MDHMVPYEERPSSTTGRAYPSPTNSEPHFCPSTYPESMSLYQSYPMSACNSSMSNSAIIPQSTLSPESAWQMSGTSGSMMQTSHGMPWSAPYDTPILVPQSPVQSQIPGHWQYRQYHYHDHDSLVDGKIISHRLVSPQRSSISSSDEFMHSRPGSVGMVTIKAEHEWQRVEENYPYPPSTMTVSPKSLAVGHVQHYNQHDPAYLAPHHYGEQGIGLGIRTPLSNLSTDAKSTPRKRATHRRSSTGTGARRRKSSGRTRSQSENVTFSCELCGKIFQREYNRKAHMQTHNPERARPQICNYDNCERSFVRRTDLMRHQESVHIKARPFHCTKCNAKFSRKDTLQRHEEDGCPRRFDVDKRTTISRHRPMYL